MFTNVVLFRRFTIAKIGLSAVMAMGGTTAANASTGAISVHGTTSGLGASGRSVLLSGSPGSLAVDPQTHTIYVPIMSGGVDVVNSATCNAVVGSGCKVEATALPHEEALAAAVDEQTGTVYVAAGADVAVLNGAHCDAAVTASCGKDVADIKVGGTLVGAAINPLTQTLYLASISGAVYVVDIAHCDSHTVAGCSQPVRKVTDSYIPASVVVNVATNTVYATNNGPSNSVSGLGDTVSVIDGRTCNATVGRGCKSKPPVVKVGSGAYWATVDQATDTVYVANYLDGTVSVINGARCNSTVTSGCSGPVATVRTGAAAAVVMLDSRLHTLFTLNALDDTVSELSTRTCNATEQSGCAGTPLNEQATPDQGPNYNSNLTTGLVVPQTSTAYFVNEGGADLLSVVDLSQCNATDTSGCRAEAPSVPDPEASTTIDPTTGTIYASNANLPQIDVLNAATCNPSNLAGCLPVAEIPMKHPQAELSAVGTSTHTLYASDISGNVAVVNTATCNATDTSGCAGPWRSIVVGPVTFAGGTITPGAPALDATTQTLYVPFGTNADEVAVINVAACNAEVASGCQGEQGAVPVGPGTTALAEDDATDTIYAAEYGAGSTQGGSVSVINGATCDGTVLTGCAHLAATVLVGQDPIGVAVDEATGTVYVANNENGDKPGNVSVINGATCNGHDVAGCSGSFPVVPVDNSPRLISINTTTNTVYVTDHSSSAVSVINGATCDAQVTTGCAQPAPAVAVGTQPNDLAVDETTGTVYVMNTGYSGSMSLVAG